MAKEVKEVKQDESNMQETKTFETIKEESGVVTKEDVVKYTKKQLMSAKKNQNVRDIIEVVVGNDELLTIKELDTKVEQFLSMEVR